MIRRTRITNQWDGMDRRYGPPNRRNYYDDNYYDDATQEVIIKEVQPQKPWWMTFNWIGLVYPVLAAVFAFAWHTNERVTQLEFKQSALTEKHSDHVKTDDEFKTIIKELDKKIDQVTEHVRSVEETMMQMYSSINTHTKNTLK